MPILHSLISILTTRKKEEVQPTPTPSISPITKVPSPEIPQRILPNFVAQFIDDEWFKDAFPNVTDEVSKMAVLVNEAKYRIKL